MQETWKVIPGWAAYEVSSVGRVRRIISIGGRVFETPKLLKPSPSKSYLSVTLLMSGVKRRVFIHHLVLEAFVSAKPDGLECRHLDGNSTNNTVGNLCWGTHKENYQDLIAHGRARLVGGRNQKDPKPAKLSAESVIEIRTQYIPRQTTRAILAAGYGISISLLDKIIAGTKRKG